jgi:hypothetical protein
MKFVKIDGKYKVIARKYRATGRNFVRIGAN